MLLTVLLGGFWVGWVTFAKLVYHVAGDGTWLWTKRLLLWSLGRGRTAFGGCYTLARPLEGFVQLHPSLWYNIHTVISHRTLSRDQHATTRQLRTKTRRPPSMDELHDRQHEVLHTHDPSARLSPFLTAMVLHQW